VILFISTGCLSPMERAWGDLSLVNLGMPDQHVAALLGPPDSALPDPTGVLWIYRYKVDGMTRLGQTLLIIGIITAPFYPLVSRDMDPVTFGIHFDESGYLDRKTQVHLDR